MISFSSDDFTVFPLSPHAEPQRQLYLGRTLLSIRIVNQNPHSYCRTLVEPDAYHSINKFNPLCHVPPEQLHQSSH